MASAATSTAHVVASDHEVGTSKSSPDNNGYNTNSLSEKVVVETKSDEKIKASSGAQLNRSTITPTNTDSQEDEKRITTVNEDGSDGTNEKILKHGGDSGQETGEEDDEVEVVYPNGLQLGLLTFGLCMATFTVALGM